MASPPCLYRLWWAGIRTTQDRPRNMVVLCCDIQSSDRVKGGRVSRHSPFPSSYFYFLSPLKVYNYGKRWYISLRGFEMEYNCTVSV